MSSVTTKSGKPFTTSAVSFIITNAGRMTAKAIAGVLHRTVKSVRRKAEKLNISLKVVR